jgi:hypothetical protein
VIVGVAVTVGVSVRVNVGVMLGFTVGVMLGFTVGVPVTAPVAVGVGVTLGVAVGVPVAAPVAVGVGVVVGLDVTVGVAVKVSVGVCVGVAVGVEVDVGVGAAVHSNVPSSQLDGISLPDSSNNLLASTPSSTKSKSVVHSASETHWMVKMPTRYSPVFEPRAEKVIHSSPGVSESHVACGKLISFAAQSAASAQVDSYASLI